MSKPKDSPAYTGIKHVWDHVCESTQHSWDRVNSSMAIVLALAISSGQRFDADDFHRIFSHFAGDRWGSFGTSAWEQFYTLAVDSCNMSAVKSFETWAGRGPFIVDGYNGVKHRVSVGSQFPWDGVNVTVTSFAAKDDNGSDTVIACSYTLSTGKVKKRYRISRLDVISERKDRKDSWKAKEKS